jgi:predicted metal-dependent RNase
LKVEMAMQKLAIEQVKQERAEAEERLKEAVRKTEVRCHQELVDAVEKAREEEKNTAAEEAAKVAKYEEITVWGKCI